MALGCDRKSFCVQLKKFIKQEFNSLLQVSRCLVTLKSMTYVNADYQIKFVSQLSQPDFVWTQSLTCLKLILLWHSRAMILESFKTCSRKLLALRIGMDHSKTNTQKLKRCENFDIHCEALKLAVFLSAATSTQWCVENSNFCFA